MAIKCPKCQYDNPATVKFCGDCGTQLPSIHDIAFTDTLEAPIKQLATGSSFAGRYQIIEELGEGGMGRVYRVLDKKLNEEVALKLIKPEIALDKRTIERFSNELKLARKISHRNIGRMFDLGEEKEAHFITMEYVPGQDLRGLIRQSKQLTIGTAVAIAREVCEGLAEAHRLGIIHRDLKPSNIIIDKEGNAKIMDFGIARSLKSKSITGAGVMIGTPEYMSPEQVEGKEVDQRSDIYSLGIILYEMVTGRVPFEGETPFALGVKHKSERPRNPRELNPQLSEDLSRLILHCLEKDKERRFRSTTELCAALGKIQGEISGARRKLPSEAFERLDPSRRRIFRFVTVLVLAAVFLVIAGYLARTQLFRRNVPAPGSADEQKWKNSVAVLPFEDLSADRSLEYLCESMTDDVATKLGGTGVLKVPSRRSTLRFKDGERGPKEIGPKLGVATVLEATLQIQNSQIRVNVKLARTEDGIYYWLNSYTEARENILTVEDEISKDVAGQLGVDLTTENRVRAKKKDPKDAKDYDILMLGRHFEKRYADYGEEEDFRKAVENLKRYVEANPDYALAYWILGNAYEHRFAIGGQTGDGDLMQAYYKTAYTLEPGLEETNLGMGWAYFYRQDFDKSYQYFKRAVELNPGNPEVNWNVGSFFRSIGLDEKAIKHYKKALVSDPLYSVIYQLCAVSYMYSAKYEEALSCIEAGTALERDNVIFHTIAARLLLLLGRHKEADEKLARAQKFNSEKKENQKVIKSVLALISAIKGNRGRALSLLREAYDLDTEPKPSYHLDVVSVYSLLGMNNEAIQGIGEGIKSSFAEIKAEVYGHLLLRSYPYFKNLRGLPQFKEIAERQKQIYEMRMKKYSDL